MTIPRAILAAFFFVVASAAHGSEPPMDPSTTTVIAIVRHGEKPEAGLGMINCAGLNRALALGPRLALLVGPPHKVIAPNPSARKADKGVLYDYNRPLLTIAPSAIAAGLPIDVSIAWSDHMALARALDDDALAGKTIYVAWEHHLALQAVKDLFALEGADAAALPSAWSDDDFDSVFVVRIFRGKKRTLALSLEHEGLNGTLSQSCVR